MTKEVPPDNTASGANDLVTTLWEYETGGRLANTCSVTAGGTSCTGASAKFRTGYAYDALGRTTTASVYSGTNAGTLRGTTTTTYAPDGTTTSVAFDGTAMHNEIAGTGYNEGTDTLTYTYDALKRIDQIKDGAVVLTDYAYDGASRVTSRIDGTIGTHTFGYDWAERQASMTSTAFTGTAGWTYRLDGTLASRALPGSAGTTAVAYDAAKRPTTITHGANSLTRTWDRVSNVTSEGRTLTGVSGDAGGNTQTFTYDPLRRVTRSSGLTAATSYTYDLDGNRTSAVIGGVTTTYTFDRTNQLIDQTVGGTTTTFRYDIRGNLKAKATNGSATTVMEVDSAGRLITIDPAAGATATFGFDALGRTATRTLSGGGGTETYRFNGSSETVTAVAGGTTTAGLLDAAGARLGLKVGATVNWTLFDPHGDLAAQLDTAGTITRAYRYDAWGRDVTTPSGDIASPWRYQGALDLSPDASDPLYDIGARLYAPSMASWTALDTYAGQAQDPLSLNRYLYAAANPATLIDPSGHDSCSGSDCDLSTYDNQAEGLDTCIANCQESSTEYGAGDDGYSESMESLKAVVGGDDYEEDSSSVPEFTVPSIEQWLGLDETTRFEYSEIAVRQIYNYGDQLKTDDQRIVAYLVMGSNLLGHGGVSEASPELLALLGPDPMGVLGEAAWDRLHAIVDANPELRDDFTAINMQTIGLVASEDAVESVGARFMVPGGPFIGRSVDLEKPGILLGRNMTKRVVPEATKRGLDYYPGAPEFVKKYLGTRVNVLWNVGWLAVQVFKGRRVFDVGAPTKYPLGPSVFYDAEHSLLRVLRKYVNDIDLGD